MTERKPAHLTFPGWVEQQIRAAEERGAFADLPGKGKPIPGLGEHRDDLAWIAEKLRRENVDVSAALPPALALAKEVETVHARLAPLPNEAAVREHVIELNTRIRRAILAPQIGPPVRVRPVDVDDAVAHWRTARPVRPAPSTRPRSASTPARSRWWRRRQSG